MKLKIKLNYRDFLVVLITLVTTIRDAAILYTRLLKNPPLWTPEHTKVVQKIKLKAKTLPCLALPNPEW